jgi:hypothetical protein
MQRKNISHWERTKGGDKKKLRRPGGNERKKWRHGTKRK